MGNMITVKGQFQLKKLNRQNYKSCVVYLRQLSWET